MSPTITTSGQSTALMDARVSGLSGGFTTEVQGRQIITAPAAVITAAMKEPTVEDIASAPVLTVQGRFVGADAPNRNGALWTSGDLQMGLPTVANGPLNWLHEARHVIGTITTADFVSASTEQVTAAEGNGDLQRPIDPHISATAVVWKWIYPDEAYVIQQASDSQMLWYSMECISKEVSCVGDGGCGATSSYSDYMSGAACEHVVQRASTRRFVDPVFLGGAIIVPPTRPGWGDADVRVSAKQAALAEAAYEEAGRPDVTANEWDQLMGKVLSFATRATI